MNDDDKTFINDLFVRLETDLMGKIDKRFQDMDKRFDDQNVALSKAFSSMQKRMDGRFDDVIKSINDNTRKIDRLEESEFGGPVDEFVFE